MVIPPDSIIMLIIILKLRISSEKWMNEDKTPGPKHSHSLKTAKFTLSLESHRTYKGR